MKKVFCLTILFCAFNIAQAEDIVVAQFEQGDRTDWESHRFGDETDYQLITENGQQFMRAQSNESASGLFKKVDIDLRKTPYLHWRWRINKALPVLNENTKQGDDFAARIYVVVSGGVWFWKTRALNYVWSGQHTKNQIWVNPFTKNAYMLAAQGKPVKTGAWYTLTRNVYDDLKRAFGDDIQHIDAIAIMTDTDNSKSVAQADYGNIRFSSDPSPTAK